MRVMSDRAVLPYVGLSIPSYDECTALLLPRTTAVSLSQPAWDAIVSPKRGRLFDKRKSFACFDTLAPSHKARERERVRRLMDE